MEGLQLAKPAWLIGIGSILPTIAQELGGWDAALKALVVLIIIDYITGLIVAGVFKHSSKSATGRLESKASFRGLIKKGMFLVLVYVGAVLDSLMNINDFARDALIYAFCANELLSILENAGIMGIKTPPALNQAVEMLYKKSMAKTIENKDTEKKDQEANQEANKN